MKHYGLDLSAAIPNVERQARAHKIASELPEASHGGGDSDEVVACKRAND
jgi:hypothetical protein